MAIHIPPCPSRWSAKHWILVTLFGTLVAIVIVAVISFSLSPARIHFSILSASMIVSDNTTTDQYYNFTLVSNNTSGRTAVRYVALSAEIWYSSTAWVPADVRTIALPSEWQPRRNATYIPFSAEYGQFDFPSKTNNTMVSDSDLPNTTVVVIAKVLFKFGLAQTRPYNVRASCKPVDFIVSNNGIFPVNCTDGSLGSSESL